MTNKKTYIEKVLPKTNWQYQILDENTYKIKTSEQGNWRKYDLEDLYNKLVTDYFRYLKKYIGTYRVIAEYDLNTNDFPRDEAGELDKANEDLYIPCKAKCRIYHKDGDMLEYYSPSLGRGHNILKQIEENNISVTTRETSEEISIYFNANEIEKIAEIVTPMISGNKTNPFSSKNLPKKKYEIPQADLSEYKAAISSISKERMFVLGKLIRDFDSVICEKKPRKFDIKNDRRQSGLKGKEYIHSIGMWNDFVKFINEKLSTIL